MSKTSYRFAAAAVAALAACLLTGGVAAAEPIWVAPGVDLGALLGPTVQLPTQLLQPIVGLLGG
ncbi:hypothetical protein [Saccharopolyspora sp. 5N708]|uniref:hypothetical protein n=1 Tax=Saccharopolyspora sp. 5N708 TaxID=3457424 RepID=UPI003FD33977